MTDQQRTKVFGSLSSALNKASGPVAQACYHHGVSAERVAAQDADAIAAMKELARELAEKLPILEGAKLLSMSDGAVRPVDPRDRNNPFFQAARRQGFISDEDAARIGLTK